MNAGYHYVLSCKRFSYTWHISARSLSSRIPSSNSTAGSRKSGTTTPRWPFLRNKSLTERLSRCFARGPGATPHRLWITGARGSGAGTAVHTVATQAARDVDGGGAAVVIFDCSNERQSSSSAQASDDIASRFAFVLQSQLAERFEKSAGLQSEEILRTMVSEVIADYPEAQPALIEAVEAISSRAGLPGVLPSGTEVQGCRDALAEHRENAPEFLVHASEAIVNAAMRQKRRLSPISPLNATLAILREAGVRVAGRDRKRSFQAPVKYLLSAADALARLNSRDVLLVLLRAEALSASKVVVASGKQSFDNDLLKVIDCFVCPDGREKSSACGSLRLLLQTSDGISAARAHVDGVEVLTIDEWSEEMARAIIIPRFLEGEDADAWHGIWASVGGHPAHLRRVAELIAEEQTQLEVARFQEEQKRKKVEHLRSMRPGRSEDAEKFGRAGEEQHAVDSLRADAREPQTAAESLLTRLPDALGDEITALDRQISSFYRHPLLNDVGMQRSPGHRAAQLVGPLRALCVQPHVLAPNGIGSVREPLLMALLDVGLLVPKFAGPEGPRLVISNTLAKSLLAAWADARCAELSWWAWTECQWHLWRQPSALTTI